LYHSQKNHRVWSLTDYPEYVLKMKADDKIVQKNVDDSMEARFDAIVRAELAVFNQRLNLLVIPRTVLLNVDYNGYSHSIICQEKINISFDESWIEYEYNYFGCKLNEAIMQLTRFICMTGYYDVAWRNNPVINDNYENCKLALIDLESPRFFEPMIGIVKLVQCINSEQIDIVQNIAYKCCKFDCTLFNHAREQRLQELIYIENLNYFYDMKAIKNGDEEIILDSHFLKTLETEISEYVVKIVCDLNNVIKNNNRLSIKNRRQISIKVKECPEENCIHLDKAIELLVNEGYVYSFFKKSEKLYVVQC
jgi:hypothetical protein